MIHYDFKPSKLEATGMVLHIPLGYSGSSSRKTILEKLEIMGKLQNGLVTKLLFGEWLQMIS